MKRILILLCFVAATQLKSQEVTDDYKFVGEIDVTFKAASGDVLISEDGKYFVIEFGYKPTLLQVYSTADWKLLQNKEVKGWTYFYTSFFDPQDQETVYIKGNGKKFHRINVRSGDHAIIKEKELPGHIDLDDHFEFNQHSRSTSGEVTTNMLPGKYILKYDLRTLKVYIWKGLLK